MARRRYQQGTLSLRGKKEKKWHGRWREDEISASGDVRRVHRNEVLGTLAQYPTKRLAQRELDRRIAEVNRPDYRPQVVITFGQFVERWKTSVLPQYKQSTRHHLASDINNHLLPYFGALLLREINAERVQAFVSGLKLGPKTVHNVVAVLRSLWRTARAWGYIASDPFAGLVLPELPKPEPRCFTIEEVLRIIAMANEPHKTFYWLAAETGMRAGELCGLRWEDVDCERRIIRIHQSAWNGKVQTPKTSSGRRVFAISRQLANQLRRRQESKTGLVFVNRLGRPWKGGKVVEKKLHPLLDSLGMPRRGLHAFRHLNGSLMDRFNVPVKVRQERLGHSTAVMTLDHYTHAVSEDDRRIASRLGRVLCPLVPKSTDRPKTGDGPAVIGQ